MPPDPAIRKLMSHLKCCSELCAAPKVLHRSGLQFFEVASYAVATGLVSLVVFRALLQRPFGAVWDFPAAFPEVDYRHVILGALTVWNWAPCSLERLPWGRLLEAKRTVPWNVSPCGRLLEPSFVIGNASP